MEESEFTVSKWRTWRCQNFHGNRVLKYSRVWFCIVLCLEKERNEHPNPNKLSRHCYHIWELNTCTPAQPFSEQNKASGFILMDLRKMHDWLYASNTETDLNFEGIMAMLMSSFHKSTKCLHRWCREPEAVRMQWCIEFSTYPRNPSFQSKVQ